MSQSDIEEFDRRMLRNSSVTIMPDGYYKTASGEKLTIDEHSRIVRLKDNAEAHAEYDRYGVPKR